MVPRALSALLLGGLLVATVYGCSYRGKIDSVARTKRGLGVNTEAPDCPSNAKYRTYDGSCNNVKHPEVGRAGRVYMRALPAKYENNDGQTPRLTAVSGKPLPNTRSISHIAHDDTKELHDTSIQFMSAAWGQFLAHDINYTPWNTVSGGCCSDDLVTQNKQHPDVYSGGDCFPIIIPEGDITWKTTQERCMEFFRSDYIIDENGVRQQYNQASSFIDGSQIYGLTEAIAKSLRSGTDGKLKSKIVNGEEFLPELTGADESVCFKVSAGDYCFAAGDDRVNLHPGLMALQTIFLRYHNKVAEKLKKAHPSYNDETLYQEARRIVIAVMQVITTEEFILNIVGINEGSGWALKTSRKNSFKYDKTTDPTLWNVFSTAAYRFGHSMITTTMNISGTEYESGDMFMRPSFVLRDFKGLVEGLYKNPIDRIDRWYTKQMTERLLEAPGKPHSGYDIVARNIQRGRDHGLPPYNDYLELFLSERKKGFEDYEGQDRADAVYPKVYDNIDDLDMYSGGLSESDGSRSVGTLFRRIISEQFHRIKFGDRFWYENTVSTNGAKVFTSNQVKALQKMRLARVICDTVPGITEIYQDVFEDLNDGNKKNELVKCSTLDNIDIEKDF